MSPARASLVVGASAPEPVALDDGRRRVAADGLDALVDAEARWLARLGGPGTRYALLADNGVGWAIADLALHRWRLLNVPLPGYFTPAQLRHALDDAGVERVLTDDAERVLALDARFARIDASPRSGLVVLARRLDPAAIAALPPGTTKITYTSGSTGSPKGVCLGAEALETVAGSLAGVTAPLGVRRHLCLLPLATLLDNLAGLLAAPLAGATCVLPPLVETGIRYGGLDVPALLGCITRHEPHSMILVPELLRVLVGAVRQGWHPPASLRFVAVGGASVSASLLEAAAAAGLPVYEGYGLSECASVVALNRPGAHRPGTAGRVLPHARVRTDSAGEIRVRGATLLGYVGDPRGTPAPAEVATGDLGELDAEGFLHVRGRAKNLLITSLGRNVSPEWVERELLLDPAIGQAVVLGEGRPFLVALVVPSPALRAAEAQAGGAAANGEAAMTRAVEAAVRAANARLPDYARVRRWAFAGAPFALPDGTLTANGRPRRPEIAARDAARIEALYELADAS
jgi:long-subunit acyl-CoA synthetase (AMP-forming)